MHSAIYLALDDEIQARIVQEIMHGLFHAFLEFMEYERITGGTSGCRCRQCACRAPRMLEFAISKDAKTRICLVKDGVILSNSPPSQKTCDFLLKGLSKLTTPAQYIRPSLRRALTGSMPSRN
jgi:hypothetical protein